MRTAIALTIGIAAGLAAAAAFFLRGDPVGSTASGPLAEWPAGPPTRAVALEPDRPAAEPHVTPAPPPRVPAASKPLAPRYGPVVEAPRTIYRCRVDGSTTYSNTSCPGAAVVDETTPVSGYDSRPSERLARLVTPTRSDDVDAAASRVVAANSGPSSAASTECLTMRRQIRDIDRSASWTGSPRQLDELRQVRQDIRTSMSRLHC